MPLCFKVSPFTEKSPQVTHLCFISEAPAVSHLYVFSGPKETTTHVCDTAGVFFFSCQWAELWIFGCHCHVGKASSFTQTQNASTALFQITAMESRCLTNLGFRYFKSFHKYLFLSNLSQSSLAGGFFPTDGALRCCWASPDSTQGRQLYSGLLLGTQGLYSKWITLLLDIVRLYTGALDLLFLMAPLLERDFMDSLSRSSKFLT